MLVCLRYVRISLKFSHMINFIFLFLAPRAPASSYNRSTNGASSAQIEELNATLVEKNLAIEGLEKERDFYFGKLRDIEVLAQEFETAENAEFSQKVLGVLYATEVNFILLIYAQKIYPLPKIDVSRI